MEKFTITQANRLIELGADKKETEQSYCDCNERDLAYKKIETELVKKCREEVRKLLDEKHISETIITGNRLEQWLLEEGFTKVMTPTIISKEMLEKMTIDEFHKLAEQVFWLDGKKCLRPMLAPNLYVVMRELKRITNGPIKIFELGSCFRKESQGSKHMNEFTMLNCVELAAVEEGKQMDELKRLARASMKVLGVPEDRYKLVSEESVVYGSTIDIEIDGIEVASGSFGPHFLDRQWGIFDTWVGIGFGIERLNMALNGGKTIKRYGRSIFYIDGQPLSI